MISRERIVEGLFYNRIALLFYFVNIHFRVVSVPKSTGGGHELGINYLSTIPPPQVWISLKPIGNG